MTPWCRALPPPAPISIASKSSAWYATNTKDRMFNIATDLDLLREKIVEVRDVRMVQIDPISAYLGVGKMDSYRTTDVRAVLAPLVELTAEGLTSPSSPSCTSIKRSTSPTQCCGFRTAWPSRPSHVTSTV